MKGWKKKSTACIKELRKLLAEKKKATAISLACLYPFIMYMIIVLIPCFEKNNGLFEFMMNLQKDLIIFPPIITKNTLPVCMIATVFYIGIATVIVSSMKNTRTDEEYGSAKFGNVFKLNNFYKSKVIDVNIQITQNFMIGLDVIRHEKNLNTLIFGGSGTRKTRGFIIPNLINIISGKMSFVVTDPKGEILTKVGKFLKLFGYDIRVLDLKEHYKSHGYNPFVYFRNDDDILIFVNQLWASMSDKNAMKGEQIWDDQAKNMLLSFMMYLYHYAPKHEQNFDMVIHMMNEVKASEGNHQEMTVIDMLFNRLSPDDPTYGYYKGWSAAKGRTLASIVATLSAKLTIFNLDSMKKLTYCDELNLTDLATQKVALFCVIPDNNTVYNFIAGAMYQQLIQQLYDYADKVMHGPLPMHVRFMMDEFANIALPDDYEKILSTARSRNMSFVIVLQNKSQIEALYEKVYKSLIGNCDIMLFLGSSELETCKYFSELMDKETVSVITHSRSYGRNASYTRNETKAARDLMTPGELRKLSNKKCVLLIRGEDPVIDYKIKLNKCKNYKLIADGKRFNKNMYEWGTTESATCSADVLHPGYAGKIVPLPKTKGKLMSDKELSILFK